MIIPAIDLIDGNTVRLFQGDYQQKTQYQQTPEQLISLYSEQGATRLHLVDLDGAKDANQRQTARLKSLISVSPMPVQVGGGVRSKDDVELLLSLGAEKVVIGSMAIKHAETVKEWLVEYGPESIVLALDVNIDEQGVKTLPTHGWIEKSEQTLEQLLTFYGDHVSEVLCTDISRDGTLTGSNTLLYKEVKDKFPSIYWQASGGIGQLSDIADVKRSNADAIILGRALLEGKFTVEDAIQCWQNA